MATKSLGTLTLDLIAKTGGFVAGMSKAERESEKWRRKVESNVKAVGKTMGIALAAGTAAAAAGLALLVNRSREAIDAQAKMAQRLRTSYESLSALGRAGELAGVSMQQIEVASRTLDINLGKASQGIGAQADALEKLKLNADDVAALPLDQRLQAINTALRENVSETERAAIAADLFGSRSAAAIQMLDPDTIAEAARQVEIFGLNLSDVDAAKVEQANDAMSTFGLLSEGVGNQLTVELAPVLRAIGDEFLATTEKAGGLGVVVRDTSRDAVNALSYLVDGAQIVGRTFDTVVSGIAAAGSAAIGFLAGHIADLLGLWSKIPGVDLSEFEGSLRSAADLADGISAEAASRIAENLETPLAGAAMRAFYDRAQEAGQAAAAAAVAGRESQSTYNKELDGTVEKLAKIDVTAKKLKLPDSIKEMIELQKDYNSLVRELQTDEERLQDQLNDRLALLEKVTFISDEARAQQTSRAVAAAFPTAPEYAGLAPEIGGAGGELKKINDAQAELEEWYSTQLSMLDSYRQQHQDLNAQWDAQELELRQQHADRLREIDQAREVAALAATEDLFGNLAGLTREFAGEQSTAYRVLFAVEKAAAIARSIVAIQTGIAQAAANPWPANLAAMASVASATASIVSTISATSISGQAHDGMMNVPKTGSYILEQGERVVPAETTAKLDATLNDIKQRRESGNNGNVSVGVINSIDPAEVGEAWAGTASFDRYVMNTVRRNQRTIKSLSL
ncbi:MAG: hypothetical protein KDH99_01470 [Alcanivoracaceae bacterium]|nr:hypothetical protein [Alcanivoracaceae bacterium]